MTITSRSVLAITLFTFFAACQPAITPQQLYGSWKYIKLETPNADNPATEPDWKLKLENPSIVFSKNNELTIWYNGKILAHGTFRIDKNNIRFKEVLANGQTREFPFYVSKLTDNEIVFETLGADGSRVTAVKK